VNITFRDDIQDEWRTFRENLKDFVQWLGLCRKTKSKLAARVLNIPKKIRVREIRLRFFEEHAEGIQQLNADKFEFGVHESNKVVCAYLLNHS